MLYSSSQTKEALEGLLDEGRLQWVYDDQCVLFSAEGFVLHQTGLAEQALLGSRAYNCCAELLRATVLVSIGMRHE